jgi:tRNA threonylcarbamoyladenosine biosynthesis protein TsaB
MRSRADRDPAAVLLAIEASQRRAGVAVRDRDGTVDVEWVRGGLRHDDDLLPAIDRLYARRGLAPRVTAAVGVSVGPGGFTGLRISVATAKMLGEALGAAIVGVPSALVAAESHEGPGPIIVALASKGSTVWAARLRRDGASWEQTGAAGLVESLDLRGVEALIADAYLPAALRHEWLRRGAFVIEPAFDPRACLAIAARWLEAGRTTDPLSLQPIYARPPEVVEPPRRVPR